METRTSTRSKAEDAYLEAVNDSKNPVFGDCTFDAKGKSNKILNDNCLYLVGEISGNGKIDLFRGILNQKALVGTTNFDGNQLNAGYNFVIDAIAIDAAITTVAPGTDVPFGSLDFGSEKLDPVINNSEFTLTVDGKAALSKHPVFDIHNPNTTRSNDERYRGISHFPIITAQSNLVAEFELPINLTADTTGNKRHFVRIALRGHKTENRF